MREASITPANPVTSPCSEHRDLDAHDRQAGQQCGLAIAAHGQHVLAEHRLLEQEAEQYEADDIRPDRKRDAEERAAAQVEE
jgi:hypothetical protein